MSDPPEWWEEGTIYLAATPIGNSGDASGRLQYALANADMIAAEDTRRVRGLCSRLGIQPAGKIVPFHDHNEARKAESLVDVARQGGAVLVVSDAGTPTVSDPGYHLVTLAADEGVPATALPGPSAALAALTVSGLPTDRFTFEGFLPRKGAEQRRRITQLVSEPRTFILFESPRRTANTLALLRDALGSGRRAAVCRELTKTHEEVVRGDLGALADEFAGREVLGEVTIVVAGAPPAAPRDPGSLAREVLELSAAEGLRLKDAAGRVAQAAGLSRNELFEAALAARRNSAGRN